MERGFPFLELLPFWGFLSVYLSFDPESYLAALNLDLKVLNCPKRGNLLRNTLQEKGLGGNLKINVVSHSCCTVTDLGQNVFQL